MLSLGLAAAGHCPPEWFFLILGAIIGAVLAGGAIMLGIFGWPERKVPTRCRCYLVPDSEQCDCPCDFSDDCTCGCMEHRCYQYIVSVYGWRE